MIDFLHADTLMLDWCINSATQTEDERPLQTVNTATRVSTNANLDN